MLNVSDDIAAAALSGLLSLPEYLRKCKLGQLSPQTLSNHFFLPHLPLRNKMFKEVQM